MGLGLSRAFTPLTLLTHLPYRSARRSPGLATTPASRLASTRREESNVCLRRYDLRPRGQQPSLLIALRSDPLACARHLKNQRDQFSLVPPIPFVPSSRSISSIRDSILPLVIATKFSPLFDAGEVVALSGGDSHCHPRVHLLLAEARKIRPRRPRAPWKPQLRLQCSLNNGPLTHSPLGKLYPRIDVTNREGRTNPLHPFPANWNWFQSPNRRNEDGIRGVEANDRWRRGGGEEVP